MCERNLEVEILRREGTSMDRNNTMITTDITEKELHPASGMLILILNIVGILFGIFLGIISPILF